MITIRPTSRTAQFALSFAFLACSAQASRDDDGNNPPRGGSSSLTGGVSNVGSGGTTGGTFVTPPPTGGTPGALTGGSGGAGGSKGGGTGVGGTATAKGGATSAGGATTGGTPGVIITGGGGGVATGTGGSASVVTCDAAWGVGNDGFVKAKGTGTACWHGYAFASASPAATSTAMPTTFGTCGTGCMLCFSGSVGATINDVALIGFNVNQAPGSSATAMMKPTGTSVTVNFTKTGTFAMRVQIQAKAATAATRWCYTIPDTATSTVTIPYAMFNTECWEGGAGKAYANEDIESIMLLIPGSATAATPFEACLTGVGEP